MGSVVLRANARPLGLPWGPACPNFGRRTQKRHVTSPPDVVIIGEPTIGWSRPECAIGRPARRSGNQTFSVAGQCRRFRAKVYLIIRPNSKPDSGNSLFRLQAAYLPIIGFLQ